MNNPEERVLTVKLRWGHRLCVLVILIDVAPLRGDTTSFMSCWECVRVLISWHHCQRCVLRGFHLSSKVNENGISLQFSHYVWGNIFSHLRVFLLPFCEVSTRTVLIFLIGGWDFFSLLIFTSSYVLGKLAHGLRFYDDKAKSYLNWK